MLLRDLFDLLIDREFAEVIGFSGSCFLLPKKYSYVSRHVTMTTSDVEVR